MRRRAVREIGTLLGVLVVLSGVVLLNYMTRQQSLKERMIAWREQIEATRESKGLELLPWKLLQKTKGTVKKGPTFDPDLEAQWGDRRVDLIGFMVPLETFRAMTEFILLPMPIECYFCERPPMRDVVLVLMKEGETADLFKEPILINGKLTLNKGPNTKFFYTIEDTTFGPGEEEGTLTRAAPSQEALAHAQAQEAQQEELFEGVEPPTAVRDIPEAPATPQPGAPVSGQQFLEQNAAKEGVVVLPSGLQYKVIREGTGAAPGPADNVRVHYRGTLIDGTEFDSSYARNEPAVFPVNRVISGWTEALQLMGAGAKWQLVIPPELAYGKRGAGSTIPPNAVLVFEVELLSVEK